MKKQDYYPPPEDFNLKETSPKIPAMDRSVAGTLSLVEQMDYFYVRIVRARELFAENSTDAYNSYAEVRLGNFRGITSWVSTTPNPEWNQVFAFSKDRIHSSFMEIIVRKQGSDDDVQSFKGRVVYEVNEAPKRIPPDSPLAPQWCKLEGLRGENVNGDLMVAIWMGTQADEAFPEAWHSDSAGVSPDGITNTKSKVYLSPRLWYLRVNVIQVQDLELKDRNRRPEVFVKATLGSLVLKSKISQSRNMNPIWNEDLFFVVAEPFENQLVLSVEDKIGNWEEALGKCVLSLHSLERRLVNKPVDARWYYLERPAEEGRLRDPRINTKIHLRVCLDGGYHVLDESTHYTSDLRPTVKQMWKSGIGVLELGILSATGLPPMKRRDDRATTDAYCVAKYGQKWVRTRTILDCSYPRWNEQYTWEVFDPCTVLTVAVFDNCHLQGNGDDSQARDSRIGKVRIRLSTLETDRIYTHSYPLVVLQPQGLKKMGEIQVAIRFSCISFFNLLQTYFQPILPTMHYLHPLSIYQLDYLRKQATQILALRLGRSEPPLREEVVKYVLDVGSTAWSTRKCRANYNRIREAALDIDIVLQCFSYVCSWEKPFLTILLHIFLAMLILYPRLILPTMLLHICLIGAWNYRWRSRSPLNIDIQLSFADKVRPDELDEEFDTFPTCKTGDAVRMRYDRLRGIAGRVQVVIGDLATQMERVKSLLNWRDPRATAIFLSFCLAGILVLYFTPFKLVATSCGFYVLRHPKFRHKLPSVPLNFFRRLPAKTDCFL